MAPRRRNPVGLDVLDEKGPDGNSVVTVQAFGTLVTYPRAKVDLDTVPNRIRVVMDAQALADGPGGAAAGVAGGAGSTTPAKAVPAVARPAALPAVRSETELSREQCSQVRFRRARVCVRIGAGSNVFVACVQRARSALESMQLPFRANSAVTVHDLGRIKPGAPRAYVRGPPGSEFTPCAL